MRWLGLSVAVLAIGCGNNPNPSNQQGAWLGQQDAGEIRVPGGSCMGPFSSEMTPNFEGVHSYSTQVKFHGKNRPASGNTKNSACDELSRYLSASTWSEAGQQVANDMQMSIDFEKTTDSDNKPVVGVSIPLRVKSAQLYFLDGSLTQKMADVELRCPGSFSLQCTKLDEYMDDCVDYKISYTTQKCTFRGDGTEVTYVNHKRSDLQFLGELSINGTGPASMKVNKASWMVMY